ncbi:MAG: beta-lactamase family protein, partial [Caulobacteraceae bacterium]|nr:beta-lactamase family protein [Caulobacteraceae bacterium]
MQGQHIAGVTVAVVQNGQVLLKKGYGVSHLDPATPVDPDRTLFRLASVSTAFTWVALMKEVEAGHIRLGTPVNLYLPEKLQVRDQGYRRQVMVRDLLTHTAGFEDRALGQLYERDPAQVRTLMDYLREERPRRVREPGVVPVFSNYGAALAGEAVAYVENRRFPDLIETEITGPLGLVHTTFREPYPDRDGLPAPMPNDLAAQVSTGYRWADGGFEAEPFDYASQAAPAIGLSSTAGDMARFMELILGGGQLDGVTLYGPGVANGFRTTLQAPAPGMNGSADGFMEYSLPGGYRGQGETGDGLWFHASLVTVPALGLGVFVAVNTDTGERLVQTLPGLIVRQFYVPSPPPAQPGSAALAAQARVYDGRYLDERRAYGGLEKFVGLLTRQVKVHITPEGRLTIEGREPTTWTPEGEDGRFREASGQDLLVFDFANGRASRFYAPSGTTVYDRVGPLHRPGVLAALAALVAVASAATLFGAFARDRRESRQTPAQARASLMQTTIAVLWLLCIAAFAGWAIQARDAAVLMFDWPGPLLLIASACAFVAAVLTVLTLIAGPAVWRGGRRLDSWNAWRKLRFTFTSLAFAAFAVALSTWGALEPWSR